MNQRLVQQIIPILQKMGLNEYESRAYVALLRHNPSTAAEVARMAEIPRTRVYDVLDRLIDLALVSRFSDQPKRYAPLPYELFLRQKAREFDEDHQLLNEVLGGLAGAAPSDAVFNLYGVNRILCKVRELIGQAKCLLYVAGFETELDSLTPELVAVVQRGVHLKGSIQIRPGYEAPTLLKEGWSQGNLICSEAERILPFAEKFGRFILVSRDQRELLFGFVFGREKSRAILTQNPILIYGLEQLVRHDMYVSEIERRFGDRIRSALGSAYVSLISDDARLLRPTTAVPVAEQ